MKAVMFSIKPFWCGRIAQGEKTVEVRKRFSEMKTPFKCYIYCTKDNKMQFWRSKTYAYAADRSHNGFDICGNGKVIGEFVCDKLESFTTDYRMNKDQTERLSRQSRIHMTDLIEYEGNAPCLWGIHISDLVIYDQPKKLSDFKPWHRECKYSDLGLAIPKCEKCHECRVEKAPQSYMFVEELT